MWPQNLYARGANSYCGLVVVPMIRVMPQHLNINKVMVKSIRKIVMLLFVVTSAVNLFAQQGKDYQSYEEGEFVEGGDTLLYRILYPENFKPNKRYPVILFLHGAGERGDNNISQLHLGGSLFLREDIRKEYPAIVLFPQCPRDEMWTKRTKHKKESNKWIFNFPTNSDVSRASQMVNSLMDSLLNSSNVDTRRVYIMGISMGGIGTLDYLYRWGDKYSAAAVICGGGNPEVVKNYKNTPIWFFHGDVDDVVPPNFSKQVYDAIKEQKGSERTRYSSYPNTNHNSWDKALSEPDLLKWLFKTKKI